MNRRNQRRRATRAMRTTQRREEAVIDAQQNLDDWSPGPGWSLMDGQIRDQAWGWFDYFAARKPSFVRRRLGELMAVAALVLMAACGVLGDSPTPTDEQQYFEPVSPLAQCKVPYAQCMTSGRSDSDCDACATGCNIRVRHDPSDRNPWPRTVWVPSGADVTCPSFAGY